jgi:hypothetical protein
VAPARTTTSLAAAAAATPAGLPPPVLSIIAHDLLDVSAARFVSYMVNFTAS